MNILWAEMVMGRNGYGPKWSLAEMVMGRNDPESFKIVIHACIDGQKLLIAYVCCYILSCSL